MTGGKVLICGNGGSAAQADHFAAELVGSGLAAIALTSPAVITALANDFEYAEVFARQIKALARRNDVLITVTTSNKSENVIRARLEARSDRLGLLVVDVPRLSREEYNTQEIQEFQIRWLHLLWKEILP